MGFPRRRMGSYRLSRTTLLAFAVMASPFAATAIGRQDIAALLTRNPEVVERARLTILPDTFRTLKAATFAWPTAGSLPPGSAIPAPPRLPNFALDINRGDKADRLPDPKPEPGLPEAFAAAGTGSDLSPAGSGSSTALSSSSGTGTGDGTMAGTTGFSAGSGTDPYEAGDDVADANDLAGSNDLADAGDPTGDPAELETAIAAGDDTLVTGLDGTGGEAGPARADPFRSFQGSFGIAAGAAPLDRQTRLIFGIDGALAERFLGGEDDQTSVASKDEDDDRASVAATIGPMDGPAPAERLGLDGRRRARAEKCLADAVYFESRGEPERGQVAVAQVVMNRVFSGYYPADVCRAVYQNARRKFSCQFTFACDNIRDVVTEPRLWKQAQRIAADMLDGKLWDSKVGRATHYHAQSVRPYWIGEMRKLDRIGEHTFYRPRRWNG